mmetsp:Transcript_39574/g.75793  ORF Transcript_39574/g.75793 Transcript_39574/m.75793 type:complete len:598 (+) Transcript_39574:73-1866(+)
MWLKVPSEGHDEPYYWNTVSGETSWTKPSGADVEWVAQKTSNGLNYYWNERTLESAWEIPGERTNVPTASSPAVGVGVGAGSIPSANASNRATGSIPSPAASGKAAGGCGWQFFVQRKGPGLSDDGVVGGSGPRVDGGPGADAAAGERDAVDEGTLWVDVQDPDSGQRYFWNFHKRISVTFLPPGIRARWQAHTTPQGNYYYYDLQSGVSSWHMFNMAMDRHHDIEEDAQGSGGPDARWIEQGAAVLLRGLAERRYNEQIGSIHGFVNGRIAVLLPDCFMGTMILVRRRNVSPLIRGPGSIVELRGLSHTHLNGQIGTVDGANPDLFKYQIKMRDGNIKVVRPPKLQPRSCLWNISLGQSPSWLEWRQEQACLFIDSGGQHRRYSLHLPLTFSASMAEAGTQGSLEPWPMIVYLHGAGGSSFLMHSKKRLKSAGLQHAAAKFVLVSPHCDWTWKDVPGPWVTELVTVLQAAWWVDPNRIYLTGCSMGGMSTWELGAQRPDLFAAIAPVAAHHNAERTAFIARQLRQMPIFVVHSRYDDTCPMNKEEPLWNRLLQEQNRWLQVNLANEIDHCNMYEKTYCDDIMLYDWLLKRSLPVRG